MRVYWDIYGMLLLLLSVKFLRHSAWFCSESDYLDCDASGGSSITAKPVFKGHGDEGTLSQNSVLYSPILKNLHWRDICHVWTLPLGYWSVPWRQVLLYWQKYNTVNHTLNAFTQTSSYITHDERFLVILPRGSIRYKYHRLSRCPGAPGLFGQGRRH